MPELLDFFPQWGWQIWLIGLLCITLTMVLEGAYREWAKERQSVDDLTEQLRQRKAVVTREAVAKIAEKSTVTELIKESQFENDTITLKYAPIPDSVKLTVVNLIFIAEQTEYMSVEGRKILIKNAPKGFSLLDHIREDKLRQDFTHIVAEYRRLFSIEELEQIERGEQPP